MAISSNKLVPILVVVAAGMVGYVAYTRMHAGDAKVSPGAALGAVPVPEGAEGGGTSLFGGALPNTRPGDIDTSAETLANVVASNKELRDQSSRTVEALNVAIKENASLKVNEEAILQRVRAQLLVDMAIKQPPAAGIPEKVPQPQPDSPTNAGSNPAGGSLGGLIDNGIGAATNIIDGLGGQRQAGQANRGQQPSAAVPGGLGYDGTGTPAGPSGASSTALTRIVVPMGYAQPTGDQSGPLVRKSLVPVRTDAPAIGQPPFQLPGAQNGLLTAGQDGTFSPGSAASSLGKADQLEPWYTIPENATLGRATAMTTIVGRVPVDGRVTDPMQFKLIVGRDNLAANGQRVPSEIAGAIVSGLAVGDMGLSCVEGLIQSITFIFQDGTIRTISQRNNGSTPGLSSSGGGGGGGGQGSGVGGQSLAATSKLGWLSDGYGNPCIPGKFVTNAPRYLADVMGAKALSVAGAAIAAAETTTSSSTSVNGSSESSTVTGNKGRYVMGKMASAGSEEVVNWLMRRLNNSFDAVVVPAGTKVAVHLDRELAIDRDPDGRRLDNSRSPAQLIQQRGTRHGAD